MCFGDSKSAFGQYQMQNQPSLPPWFCEQETPPWPCSPCSFSFLPISGQGGRWKLEEESTQKQKENKFLNRILNAGGELFSSTALWIIINMLIYGGIKNTSEYIGLVRSSWSAEDVSELSSLLLASLITCCLAAVWFLSQYAPLLTDLFLAPVRVCFLCNLPVCRSWGLWPIWVNTAGGAPPAQFGVCTPWFLAPQLQPGVLVCRQWYQIVQEVNQSLLQLSRTGKITTCFPVSRNKEAGCWKRLRKNPSVPGKSGWVLVRFLTALQNPSLLSVTKWVQCSFPDVTGRNVVLLGINDHTAW